MITRRQFFAEEIGAVAHLASAELVAAFATVLRERFLGPGPWQIARPFDEARPYRTTPDADPKHVLHDVAVAIDPERRLNNGQPSSLARWIEPLAITRTDRVLHVGAGTGYYTAILAELGGHVDAYEVDAGLAERARANLADLAEGVDDRPRIHVVTGDASTVGGPYDAILVNAGCTYARPEWLAALAPGGRIVLPLTIRFPGVPHGVGAMLYAARRDDGPWPARMFSQVGIYDCANARDTAHEVVLRALAAPTMATRVAALAIEPHSRGAACLAHLTDGFCLQAEPSGKVATHEARDPA